MPIKSKLIAIAALLICTLSALPMAGQESEWFFKKGDAVISGKITDYNRNLGFDNISLQYINPLTGVVSVKAVDIADDGTFSAVIGMEAPGFIYFDGCNNYLSARYYAEPAKTLYVEFAFENIKRLTEDYPDYYYIGQRVCRFGGDTGEINRQLSACPLLQKCDTRTLGYETVPSVAAQAINAVYAENKKITENYIASNHLHPIAVRLLRNELLGDYASNFANYEKKRYINMMMEPDAPALKENPDASFYDWLKQLLTETDEWFLTSKYMDLLRSYYLYSYFPYLFDAERRGSYDIHYDPMAFLKSKGASLTAEEEEVADWYARHAGTTVFLTPREGDAYLKKIAMVYQLAKRSGLEQEYNDYVAEQLRILEEKCVVDDDSKDIPYNVNLTAGAIKRFVGSDEVPFIWQVIQASILTDSEFLSAEDHSKERTFEILAEIEGSNAITYTVIQQALADFYEETYRPQGFDLPDNEIGRVIKQIIEPYKGKVVLLDFWGISCGPCRAHIEESADQLQRNHDHPDYKRIFISCEMYSPIDAYNKYVSQYLADETCILLSDSDFRKLMDLLGFIGLPNYTLIDRAGRVAIPNLNYSNLDKHLSTLGVTLN